MTQCQFRVEVPLNGKKNEINRTKSEGNWCGIMTEHLNHTEPPPIPQLRDILVSYLVTIEYMINAY